MRVIKRKRGELEFFYLQHSFRELGRVITKERYLGSTIPPNLGEIISKLEGESKKSIFEALAQIKDNFQEEWKRYPETVKEKELAEIAIAFTYNTNAIEGSTITLEETRGIVHDGLSPNKSLREVKETEAHAKVFLAMLKKKDKLSNQLLLGWHQSIFGETKPDISGKYRDYLVRVGHYRAPDWQDVKKLMNQLLDFVNSSDLNPVELAAIAHYRFEKIHPFGDGNGRVGRLLLNYILWHGSFPMIVLEHKKRRSYYKALDNTEEKFRDYLIRKYILTHKNRLKKQS